MLLARDGHAPDLLNQMPRVVRITLFLVENGKELKKWRWKTEIWFFSIITGSLLLYPSSASFGLLPHPVVFLFDEGQCHGHCNLHAVMQWNNVGLSFYFPIKVGFTGSDIITVNNSHSAAFTYGRYFRHVTAESFNGIFGVFLH